MIARTHTNSARIFQSKSRARKFPLKINRALPGMPHAAARFAGNLVTTGNGLL
jgi:hypothetical protein